MALINCPNCNSQVSNKAKKCPHCGISVQEALKPKITCPECGQEITEEITVCPSCGFPLKDQEDEQDSNEDVAQEIEEVKLFCPECGKKVTEDSTRCLVCGFPLESVDALSQVVFERAEPLHTKEETILQEEKASILLQEKKQFSYDKGEIPSQQSIAGSIKISTKNSINTFPSYFGIFLSILGLIFLLVSGIMGYKGYDKMKNYRNTDYSSVNAYVGGDAYNYIINGNYATGFFVLSTGFLVSGTLCIGFGNLLNKVSEFPIEKQYIGEFEYNNSDNTYSDYRINNFQTPSSNQWKCPECGKINMNYIGTCGCGNTKPS